MASSTNKAAIEPMQPDFEETQNFDAEVVKEAIAEGDEKSIEVDMDADYETAQRLSTSSISAEEAEDIVAPEFEVSQPEDVVISSNPTGDSIDYTDLAKDINPAPAGAGNITDDLVEKAIAMGQPGGN